MFLTDPGLAAALRRADVETLLLPEVAQGRDGPRSRSRPGAGVPASAARNLASLRDRLGSRFAAGVVLHSGPRATVLGDRIAGMPLATLWV